jgi:predicted ATPase
VALGWSLAALGNPAEGVALARQGMAASVEFGQRLHHSQLAAMLGEACLLAGHAVEALDVADEGIASFALYRDLICAPDLWLLKGEALGRLGAPEAETEECFAAGLALARALGARVSELRAATLLARHQQRQGRAVDARQTLQPVYAWFTEGHTTPDLCAASTLLTELAA